MKNSQIKIDNLTWKPDKTGREILKDVTITFEKGHIYGIIGPNGSGKTSLIRHILRFLEITEGSITLDNKVLPSYRGKDLAKRIALVPQNTNMDSTFQVEDVVMMGRMPYQKKFTDVTVEDFEMVEEALEITDCTQIAQKQVSLLSGGESQRVATARAIAQDTDWLILDEPISNLDVKHQMDLMDSLMHLNQKKEKTVIAVLHDINIAAGYCDRIIMMKEGTVFAQGETKEVMTTKNLESVYGIRFQIVQIPNHGGNYYVPCKELKEEV